MGSDGNASQSATLQKDHLYTIEGRLFPLWQRRGPTRPVCYGT